MEEETSCDLFAAMPPLEAKKAFRCAREQTRNQEEMKLMVIDVKKAHIDAKCNEEKWVELLNEFKKFGKIGG